MAESSFSTDAPLPRALDAARRALAVAPAGLLTDFDGTLSPIVADPSLATLVEGASGALEQLTRRLAVVAIITGRAPLDSRRMTGVPGLLIAGSHGIEWLEPDAEEPVVPDEARVVRAGLEAVLSRTPALPGVEIEDKGTNASVHFRNAPDPDGTLRAILDALGDVEEHGLRIGHGRLIVELRPVGLGDKGSAARAIVERFALRGVVVMGDDITDLDMFHAIAELRAAGELRAAIIGVGGADREVPAEILAASDAILTDPREAATFLSELAVSA